MSDKQKASAERSVSELNSLLYGVWLRVFVALYPFVWGDDALKACCEERRYDRNLHKW